MLFDNFHQHCPLWLFDDDFLPVWVRAGRCTHVLAGPASCILKVNALLPKTSKSGARLDIRVTQSLKAFFQACPTTSMFFTLSVLMKLRRPSIILCVASEPWSSPPSSSATGFQPSTRFVVSPTMVKNGVHLSRWHRKGSVQSHFVWLRPMCQRQDPTAFFLQSHLLQKRVAVFARYIFAVSNKVHVQSLSSNRSRHST